MAKASQISIAIIAETRRPIWGELFKKVLAGELTPTDIQAAQEIGSSRPDWMGVVAGGNPNLLDEVAEVALTDFIATVMLEADGDLR